MKEVLDSQAMTDAIIVKATNDILTIKKTKEENDAALTLLDTKIDMMNQEIDTLRNSKNDKANDISRSGKPSSLLKCTVCDIKFNIFFELERHIQDSHEIHDTFKCDKCEKEFVLTKYLSIVIISLYVNKNLNVWIAMSEKSMRAKMRYFLHDRTLN